MPALRFIEIYVNDFRIDFYINDGISGIEVDL
jgi:hypothetical protein